MVMGQNSEVSKKLRAAMKAKLDELGVVVDDELPDYIMVMIANKKDKQHMKNDLNLFLGKQTSNFCDWLFDLFERLNSAKADLSESSAKEPQPSSSRERKKSDSDRKKEEEREKEREKERERTRKAKERDDKERQEKEDARRRAEKEREKEREREREKEKEKHREKEERETRERRREHERVKREEHGRHREENRKGVVNRKERRSRSKTWSDDEKCLEKRTLIIPSVVKPRSPSPEEPIPKVSSKVIVKRKPPTESKSFKGTSSMFLRAINEASASAGYGASLGPVPTNKPKSPMKNRLTRPASKTAETIKAKGRDIIMDSDEEDDSETIVCNTSDQHPGPQITVTLKGGKDHIRTLQRTTLKRKANEAIHKNDKKLILAPTGSDSTSNSPTMAKWNGHININEGITSDEEHFDDDEEAEIDAVIASTRKVRSSLDDDILPPTHQLSRGVNYTGYNPTAVQQNEVPLYVPTPIVQIPQNVMQQPIQNIPGNETAKIGERCVFWPTCREGDNCQYIHPTKTCTTFPSCQFGKRCIYIHPPCRYGTGCKNPTCTFTHGGKVMGQFPETAPVNSAPFIPEAYAYKKKEYDVPLSIDPTNPLSSMIPCRFMAQCCRPGCTFKHPKECRYGSACRTSGCYFYHPPAAGASVPTPAPSAVDCAPGAPGKYKWTPSAPAIV